MKTDTSIVLHAVCITPQTVYSCESHNRPLSCSIWRPLSHSAR